MSFPTTYRRINPVRCLIAQSVRAGWSLLVLLGLLGSTGCAWRYSVGAAPFAITKQPANATIPAEQTAAFAVAAAGGGTLRYQWFKDGIAISGATSSSYGTPTMPLTSNGSVYKVVVTDGSQSITSDPASLTVTPLSPQLALSPIPNQPFSNTAAIPVSTTSLSQGPITLSVASGAATMSGSFVSTTGLGPVVIEASQAANGDYSAATATSTFDVTQNVIISPITPGDFTMAPGTQAFSATVVGGETDTIVWKATGGSFSGNVWSTPDTVGTYTITAQSVDDPTKTSTTPMTVSAPIITQQPVGGQYCLQSSVNLTVAAKYAATYQWELNGKSINGANGTSYAVPSVTASLDAGQYTAVVANPAGSVVSAPAAITVGSSIVTNPKSLTAATGQTASFSVSASGVSPFSYQWYLIPPGGTAGVPIQGATQSLYTTPALNGTYNGNQYYATVQDACGQVLTSTSATLTVTGSNVPPTIITQPLNQTVTRGSTASMVVVATGSPQLSYQWYWVPAGSVTGELINGATTASYLIPAAATLIADDQDEYYVVVTNPYGQATSVRAVLAVGAGIQITKQPTTDYVKVGDSASYSVTATSLLPLTYQWYEAAPGSSAFSAIPGATSTSYSLTNATLEESASNFYVIVSNGSTTPVQSDTAALFVGPISSVPPCEWSTAGDALALDGCSYQLTAGTAWQAGEIVWPTLVATDNVQLSFTVTLSNTSPVPADGFAVVLGDPSLGATPTSVGLPGEGLGARGIPGLVLAFDDYYNDNPGEWPIDPQVPYLGVGRSENDLWESPYNYVNTTIPALAVYGQAVSHDYVLQLFNGYMTMTMDGQQVFSGLVSVPAAAYLYATSSTGNEWEQTVFSNISAVVAAP